MISSGRRMALGLRLSLGPRQIPCKGLSRPGGINCGGSARVVLVPESLSLSSRPFGKKAKGKGKKKKDRGESSKKAEPASSGGASKGMVLDMETPRKRMGGALTGLKESLAAIKRPGKADPHAIETLTVVSPDSSEDVLLSTLAQVSSKNPQTVLVDIFDEAYVKNIIKGLNDADTGMAMDVKDLRVALTMPKPSQELRKKLVRDAKEFGEHAKTSIAKVRQDSMTSLKKSKGVSEDEIFSLKEEVEKMAQGAKKVADKIVAEKETEIMKS